MRIRRRSKAAYSCEDSADHRAGDCYLGQLEGDGASVMTRRAQRFLKRLMTGLIAPHLPVSSRLAPVLPQPLLSLATGYYGHLGSVLYCREKGGELSLAGIAIAQVYTVGNGDAFAASDEQFTALRIIAQALVGQAVPAFVDLDLKPVGPLARGVIRDLHAACHGNYAHHRHTGKCQSV